MDSVPEACVYWVISSSVFCQLSSPADHSNPNFL